MSNPLQHFGDALADLVAQTSPSLLRVEGARRPSTATVWSEDLAIVPTHVLGGKDQGFVTLQGGERRQATVVGRDPTTDLSVLRIEGGGLVVPTWSDGAELKVGHLVVALGRPGSEARATLGMLSGLGGAWVTRLGAAIDWLLDVDGELPRGFSGGPLVTAAGAVIGINTHALMRGGTSVPTATVRRVVEQLVEHGEIRPGYIGVAVQPAALGAEAAALAGQPQGLLVTSVVEDGPAQKAQLRVGDVLVAANDRPLHVVEELLAALSGQVGATLTLKLLRGTELQSATAEVIARPQRQRPQRGPRREGGRPHGGRGRRHGHGPN